MPSYSVNDRQGRFAKVTYKGINTTGWRDIVADEAVKPTFRSTGIIEDSYDPETGREVQWGVEVWIVTEKPVITESMVYEKLQEAMRYARREIPFIGGTKSDAKIQTNQVLVPPEDTHTWKGRVRVKGRTYVVGFREGKMLWD